MKTRFGHETRYSDSSFYDEVCEKCGATDAPGGGLKEPCPEEDSVERPWAIPPVRVAREQERGPQA
jgi:hypothetical protein